MHVPYHCTHAPYSPKRLVLTRFPYSIISDMLKDIATFESHDSLMESEERRGRLRRRNQRDRDCRAAESAQQREARLTKRRVRDRAHHASRSAAQRERVLGHRRGRLASQTSDQRTCRLELGRA